MQTLPQSPTVVKPQKIGLTTRLSSPKSTVEGKPLFTFTAGAYTSPNIYYTQLAALDAAARLCYRNPAYAMPKAWQDELIVLWTRQGVDAAIYGTTATLWNVYQRRAAENHLADAESVLQEADALLSTGVGYSWDRQVDEAVAEAVAEGLVAL
jgi:hypothetical protein